MAKLLLVLENDDVAGEQNLAAVTQELTRDAIESAVFEPIAGFERDIPKAAAGVIVGGGLPSVNDPKQWIRDEIALIERAIDGGLPVLGICFGHQLIGKMFGSAIVRRDIRVGFADIERVADSRIFSGLPASWRSAVYHRDRVEAVPDGFELIATSDYCAVQAMHHAELPIFSVQFHPEIQFGINERFADPVPEWDDETAFEPAPNKRIIDNFVDLCLRYPAFGSM